MGSNLRKLILEKDIEIQKLRNRKIGIDGYNWAHQFLSTIRTRTGELLKDSEGRVTSHILGLFNRTVNLLKEDIKPCFVWDGKPPEFKSRTLEKRKRRKKAARKKFESAKTDEEKRKYAQQLSKLNEDMVDDAVVLIEAMGIPCVKAPSEGEAQISHMVRKGDLWACASQDWDSILFGSPLLIRNLSISGKRKVPGKKIYVPVNPKLVDLKENLKELGIDRKQLIIAAMLIGTDYCRGIKGYGPKRALELIKKEKTLENVLKVIDWNSETKPQKILDWFINPEKTEKYQLEWKDVDVERILKILVDKHEFSQDRIENQLKSVLGERANKNQKGLSQYF